MTRVPRERLRQPYLATVYRVEEAGPRTQYIDRRIGRRINRRIDLRIGRRAPPLDRLLHRKDVRHWAFITACNPASRVLPRWRNCARQRRLRDALRRTRVVVTAVAMPDLPNWTAEPGFLVAPVSCGRALRIGRRFGQYAVVAGRRGHAPALVWTG
ncbi:MAG: DUF3293 domain-containing protein [Burkholderiales bacterium]|nr:DUF3293 domain-containing protein [Burkholderiales bacterium]